MTTPSPAGTPNEAGEGTAQLDTALVRGIAWIGLLRWSAQVASWVATLAVVRFVAPSDYGIISMVMPIISLAVLLVEGGITQAIISMRRSGEDDLHQLHALSLGFGLAGTLIVAALAQPIAWFIGEARLIPLVLALSTTLLFENARTVPLARFALALDYKRLATFDAVKSLTSAVVVLAAAVAGFGYWSLALGYLVSSIVATVLVLRRHPTGAARPDLKALLPVVKYGATFVTGKLIWFLYSSADFMTVGRVLGHASLGQYAFAWNIASLPGEKIVNVVTAVTQPFFAAAKGDIVVIRWYVLRLTRLLALAVVPPLIGMCVMADDLIPVVFGAKWLPAAGPLRLLALYHSVYATSLVCTQVLAAMMRARTATRASFFTLCFLIPGFFIGAKVGGVMGVGIAWLLVLPISVGIPLRAALELIETRFVTYAASYLPALVSSALIAVAVVAVRAVLPASTPLPLQLAAEVAVAAVTYFVHARLSCREDIEWLRSLARARKEAAAPAAATS